MSNSKITLDSTVRASRPVGMNGLQGQSGKVVGYLCRSPDVLLVQFGADVAGHDGNGEAEALSADFDPSLLSHWYVSGDGLVLVDPAPAEPSAPMTKSVLDLLRSKGAITSLEAQGVLRCRQLPARILELKRLGHKIVTEMKLDPTGQRYARYHLEAT